ncbi:MAG: WecB/TagA/CpsF family glycosyltransferase [Firmicutes bacterium]|nr:WecB/TagA/CpsF family glycosyltransferase [Bacillota bacterium]
MAEAVGRCEGLILRRRPATVVTVNPELIMHAARNPGVARAVREADLVVPDGIGVVWASRVFGRPVPERVPGVELAGALLGLAAARGFRVFLLGAEPGVAEEAARRAKRRHPRLVVAGVHHGYFGPEQEPAVLDLIRRARPDIVLVGMGAPRQELWIARHRHRWSVPLAVGVGGTLDVLSGRVARAPRWMQRAGLEWLYRLLRQPARIRRAAALPRFALKVLLDARRRNLL